jgi:hypothetical protein
MHWPIVLIEATRHAITRVVDQPIHLQATLIQRCAKLFHRLRISQVARQDRSVDAVLVTQLVS